MKNIKKLIEKYSDSQNKIFEYFQYVVNNYGSHPTLISKTDNHWMLLNGEGGDYVVVYSPKPLTKEHIESGIDIYKGMIYFTRIYRQVEYTMMWVNPTISESQFLMIFDNQLECRDIDIKNFYTNRW